MNGSFARYTLLCFVPLLLGACAATATTASPSWEVYQNLPSSAWVVLPADSKNQVCSVCLLPVAASNITEGNRTAFGTVVGFELEKSHRVRAMQQEVPETERKTLPFALDEARLRGTDLLLAAVLLRFDQRQGSDYAVRTPASLSYHLHLLHPKDGQILWSNAYEETQTSLAENLLTADKVWQRKAKWLTAEQLAHAALRNSFQQLPPLEGSNRISSKPVFERPIERENVE